MFGWFSLIMGWSKLAKILFIIVAVFMIWAIIKGGIKIFNKVKSVGHMNAGPLGGMSAGTGAFNATPVDYLDDFTETRGESAGIVKRLNAFVVGTIKILKRGLMPRDLGGFGDIPRQYQYFAEYIVDRYNPTVVREGHGENGDTSFVINKGKELVMCMKDREGRYHDMQLLKYVILHEISHIGSIEFDHGDEFWSNFQWLLKYLSSKGYYTPDDYSKRPVEYCKNIMLKTNPME